MVQQNRNIMTLMNVLAHASSLRRKRRGIYPQGIQGTSKHSVQLLYTDQWPLNVDLPLSLHHIIFQL
jgi:hypothetical protein